MRDRARIAADLAVALAVAWAWLFTAASLNTYFPARIDRMVAFAADRPFMTRPLVPAAIRMASAVLPEAPVLPIGLPPSIELATLVVSAAFVWLAIHAARRLMRAVTPASNSAESLIAWSAALALVILTHGRNGLTFGVIYDPASLALTMLAVALISERAWSSYVPAFALAAVNRESAAFLIPVFALAAWPVLGRRRFIELFAIQVGTFVAIRVLLEMAAVWTLDVPTKRYWPTAFVPTAGESVVLVAAVLLLAIGIARASARALPVFALPPIALAGYLANGSPGEYRVFLEAVPALVVAAGALLSPRANSVPAVA